MFVGEDDYIIMVNNDIFYKLDFVVNCWCIIGELLGVMIGLVLVDKYGKIYYGGMVINWYMVKYCNVNWMKYIDDFVMGYYEFVLVLVGCGMVFLKWVFEKVGFYDEKYLK